MSKAACAPAAKDNANGIGEIAVVTGFRDEKLGAALAAIASCTSSGVALWYVART